MDIDVSRLSVIIATHNAAHVIESCITALYKQKNTGDVEIIVADSSTDNTDRIISDRFPEVKLLHFTDPLTIPHLRGYAIAESGGGIIAIIDPFSIVDNQWCAELIKAHKERPEIAIGGAVELYDPEGAGLVRWANYINEYGRFILPFEAGVVNILPGSNISYKRRALPDSKLLREKGFWKTFVNQDLESENNSLWLVPSVRVYLNKPLSFIDFFHSRYFHGRCYAAMRVTGRTGFIRYCRALTTPILPLLFLWRLARNYWPKHRYRKKFVLVLPLIFMLDLSWSWGELWGYLLGQGRSCKQLFY